MSSSRPKGQLFIDHTWTQFKSYGKLADKYEQQQQQKRRDHAVPSSVNNWRSTTAENYNETGGISNK